MDDFEQAKRSADGLGEFIGADTAGERIMAVTCLIEEPAGGNYGGAVCDQPHPDRPARSRCWPCSQRR